MKLVSVVGARPQFVKLAPIARACTDDNVDHVIIHTGQHYDPIMSDSFFDELAIPRPNFHLDVGSAGHAKQTADILAAIEPLLLREQPDWVLVYGDTNSTLAATVAAVKIHQRVAHLEAGLRSFNRAMPEEHNRVLTDHASDLLLAPTGVAMGHLAEEGLADRSALVGDVMADVCLGIRDQVQGLPNPLAEIVGDAPEFFVATVHRAENTDSEDRLRQILTSFAQMPIPVVLLAHPRLPSRATQFGLDLHAGSLVTTEPLAYPEMINSLLHSRGLITDSGGLQKEAYMLGVPCTTLRTETEWTETISDGWNELAIDLTDTVAFAMRPPPSTARGLHFGDGSAAVRAVAAIRAAS